MARDMSVATYCNRCDSLGLAFWRCRTVTVYLPIAVIADATSFAQKHQASLSWGIKPSCADLQLVNLVCAERCPSLRRAYLTVGLYAVTDELTFSANGLTDMLLDLMCGRNRQPTAWRSVSPRMLARLTSERTALEDGEEGDDGVGPEPHKSDETGVPADDAFRDGHAADEPSREAKMKEAAAAMAVEEQQRAYVEGNLLHSTTTMTQQGAGLGFQPRW